MADMLADSIQQRAYAIIKSGLGDKVPGDLSVGSRLSEIGFDSMAFTRTIVALEKEFNFEFDDEKLLISEFPTIQSMLDYVETRAAT